MDIKKLTLYSLSFLSLTFAQSEQQNSSNLNPILIQIQNLNFQAGKQVISLGNSTVANTPVKIKPKEFEKTKYKEVLKPYLKNLSKLSSEELNRLIEENQRFIAVYKANKIYLTVLAYQTDNDLGQYITTLERNKGNKPFAGKPLKVAWVVSKPLTKQNQQTTKAPQQNNNQGVQQNTQSGIEVEGYCAFTKTIKVYTKPFYVKTVCFFNNDKIDRGYLFGQVIPDLEQKQVVFKPIMFEDLKGNKYAVQPILVLNGGQTSPNIATYVNERELEKVLASATKNTMADTKDMLKEYIKGQGTNITINGDVVIEQKKYSLADIGQFAIRDFLASLVEAGADLFQKKLSNIPVIFTIEKGTLIYVHLILKPLKK